MPTHSILSFLRVVLRQFQVLVAVVSDRFVDKMIHRTYMTVVAYGVSS